MRSQPYQYRHCGLENVYLVNGYTIKDSPYGEAISIHDMDGLHRAIGMYLVRERVDSRPMSWTVPSRGSGGNANRTNAQ